MGKPPGATRSNEIPVIIIQSQESSDNMIRASSPPPQYELPPAYENLPKYDSKEQLTSHATSNI